MDRGNRRSLISSTLLAVPITLWMVSVGSSAPPVQVVQAVGESESDSPQIQQVVGKQPASRSTRSGGLLNALGGGSDASASSRSSQPRSRGILKGLLSSESASTVHQHNHTQPASTSHHQPPTENWDGIPYHQVNRQRSSPTTARVPLSDPHANASSRATATGQGTRIIRGSSARTIQARPASSRRSVSQADDSLTVPRPVPEVTVPRSSASRAATSSAGSELEPLQNQTLSTSSSSRRSGRRSVQALPAPTAAKPNNQPQTAGQPASNRALVPKVARRQIDPAQAGQPDSQSAGIPTTTPAQRSGSTNEASTALSAISPPPDPANRTPSATLSPPSISAAAPDETPDLRPVPTNVSPGSPRITSMGIPSQPAAHRSGPPPAAFQSAEVNQDGQTTPYQSAAAPVGSGVVPDQASQPSGSTADDAGAPAQPATNPSPQFAASPYQQPAPYQQPGQPQHRIAARPNSASAPVPMQPIGGYYPPSTAPIAPERHHSDNFAPTNSNSRPRDDYAAEPMPPGTTAVTSELPGIRVITHGPGEIMIRQSNQYEIRVENRGSIDAKGLTIRAVVPEWAELRGQNATAGQVDTVASETAERLVWTIDQLPAGATERMFVQLKAARSGTYDLDVDWVLRPQSSVAKVRVHEPKLGLSIDGPDEVVYGQSQTYRVRVLNPGDGIAPNVVFTLSPNSATPQTQRIGDIPPGKEAQFEVELTAQDLGDLKIHGLASGDLELRAEASKTIRVASAKLEAVLSGPELKYQNTESMYTLQVKNAGTATSEKIFATLRLPVGVKYIGGIEEAQQRAQQLRWEITALAPGASRNYQFRCNMTATGEHLFAFDCRGSAAGQTNVNLATRVESIADLVLSISDPPAPAPIGTDVSYQITIRNRGSKEATDVKAVAQFSHGIEPQRMEGQSGEVVTGQVLFDSIPRIGPGQEITLRVIARAEQAGHHRFRTEVSSGDTVLVAEEATHYMSPISERVSRRSGEAQDAR